jgi:hypothetical protein
MKGAMKCEVCNKWHFLKTFLTNKHRGSFPVWSTQKLVCELKP